MLWVAVPDRVANTLRLTNRNFAVGVQSIGSPVAPNLENVQENLLPPRCPPGPTGALPSFQGRLGAGINALIFYLLIYSNVIKNAVDASVD